MFSLLLSLFVLILCLVSTHFFVPCLLILDPLALRASPHYAWQSADFCRLLFPGPGLLAPAWVQLMWWYSTSRLTRRAFTTPSAHTAPRPITLDTPGVCLGIHTLEGSPVDSSVQPKLTTTELGEAQLEVQSGEETLAHAVSCVSSGGCSFSPFSWFFPRPPVVSSHACVGQYSAEDSGNPLQLCLWSCLFSGSLPCSPESRCVFSTQESSVPCQAESLIRQLLHLTMAPPIVGDPELR